MKTWKWMKTNSWYGDTSIKAHLDLALLFPLLPQGKIIKMQKIPFSFGVCSFKKQLVNSKPHYTTHIPIKQGPGMEGWVHPLPLWTRISLLTLSSPANGLVGWYSKGKNSQFKFAVIYVLPGKLFKIIKSNPRASNYKIKKGYSYISIATHLYDSISL